MAAAEPRRLIDYKDIEFDDSLKILAEKSQKLSVAEQRGKSTMKTQHNHTRRPSLQHQIQITKELNPRSLLYVESNQTWKSNAKPFVILSSSGGASELGIDQNTLSLSSNLPFLTGTSFHSGANLLSSNYGGYQHGSYQILGDGRTVYLGNYQMKTFQLRGIGRTAISAKDDKDGLITLHSAINEYFVTEALAKLKIPTIRSLAVVASQYPCSRNSMNVSYATAHTTRFAQSFITFGHFDYFHLRGEHHTVKLIADSIIETFFPEAIELEHNEMLHTTRLISGDIFARDDQNIDGGILASANDIDEKIKEIGNEVSIPLNRYAIFFRRVVERTAHLIAHWQANGFVHGLMNTENMSILGLSMNFIHSGFMDVYNPQWTSNNLDHDGRYSFDSQPAMAIWALSRLSLTFVPLIGESFASAAYSPSQKTQTQEDSLVKEESSIPATRTVPLGFVYNAAKAENILREIVHEFEPIFCKKLGEIIFEKLGLISFVEKDFQKIINPLLDLLAKTGSDYTIFFRLLNSFSISETKYNLQISYQPNGLHEPTTLRDNPATDCLSLILKSLLALHDLEAVTRPLTSIQRDLAPSALLSLEDASELWKLWAHVYRARLISQLPANRKTPEAMMEEDNIRQKKLKSINPKFALKSWIVHDSLAEVEKQFLPIADLLTNARRKQENEGPGAQLPCFKHLNQIEKIIINDMYGEISDAKSGWREAEDKEMAIKWAHGVPAGKSNMANIFPE